MYTTWCMTSRTTSKRKWDSLRNSSSATSLFEEITTWRASASTPSTRTAARPPCFAPSLPRSSRWRTWVRRPSSSEISDNPHIVVLVTGPHRPGGKSTTLAEAMVTTYKNESEFGITSSPSRIRSKFSARVRSKCLINQREVHRDTARLQSKLLRSALREDPDVILVGEMRDLENSSASALSRRRDRPLGVRHAAHEFRRQDHRPHRGLRLPASREGDMAAVP